MCIVILENYDGSEQAFIGLYSRIVFDKSEAHRFDSQAVASRFVNKDRGAFMKKGWQRIDVISLDSKAKTQTEKLRSTWVVTWRLTIGASGPMPG